MPPGHRAIGLKWVFILKRNEEEEVVKHKTHLVTKGYIHKQGVDFEEIFASVARLEFVRLLLAIAVHHFWEVHHMDVKSAFLNGDRKETVYVRQPPGFLDNDNPSKVCACTRHSMGFGKHHEPGTRSLTVPCSR